MNKHVESIIIKSSAQMEIEELLEGKSGEFKEAFNLGLQCGVDLSKKFLELYFDIEL